MQTHARYYTAATGTWRGHARLTLTSLRALFAERLPLLDLVANLGLACTEAILGPTPLVTQIRPTDDPLVFEHTATLSRFGHTLYVGHRTFHLGDDGHSVQITGREAQVPFIRRFRTTPDGHATIHNDTQATYTLTASGQIWTIEMAISPTHGDSTLSCPWGTATETLRRA